MHLTNALYTFTRFCITLPLRSFHLTRDQWDANISRLDPRIKTNCNVNRRINNKFIERNNLLARGLNEAREADYLEFMRRVCESVK